MGGAEAMTPLGPAGIDSRMAQIQARIDALSPASQSSPAFAFALHKAVEPMEPLVGNLCGTIGGPVSGDKAQLQAMAGQAAQKYGLDPKLFSALVEQESGWNPQSTSRVGAQGLCQLMPKTAAELGVADAYDPAQSLEGGAKYLRQMLDRFGGRTDLALAAYNGGPGVAERAPATWPAETKGYVRTILAHSGVAT